MDMLIFAAAAAVLLVLGYFTMGRLDAFLERNRREILKPAGRRTNKLKIAFETPAIAASAAETLAGFCRRHPGVEFSFVSGSASQIMRKLSGGDVDVGVVLQSAGKRPEDSVVIPLKQSEVFSRELDCAIEPLPGDAAFAVVMIDRGELSSEKYALMNSLLETFRHWSETSNIEYRKNS